MFLIIQDGALLLSWPSSAFYTKMAKYLNNFYPKSAFEFSLNCDMELNFDLRLIHEAPHEGFYGFIDQSKI